MRAAAVVTTLALGMATGACGSTPRRSESVASGCKMPPPTLATPDDREALFLFLTANSWNGPGCAVSVRGLPPTCDRLHLHADGRFSWTAISDYVERGDAGTWNFAARDAKSGTLFFSDGGSVLFRKAATGLWTSRSEFVYGDPLPDLDKDEDDLPRLAPAAFHRKVAGTCWTKTNDLDRGRIPETLAFGDGRLLATYRGGRCQALAAFTVDGDQFVTVLESDGCKGRVEGYDAMPSYEEYELSPNLLALNSNTYHRAGSQRDEMSFVVDGDVRLTGSYRGTWAQGKAMALHLTLQNRSEEGVRLKKLVSTFTSISRHTHGATATIERTETVIDFSDARMAAGQIEEAKVSITPPFAGDTLLKLALSFKSFDGEPSVSEKTFALDVPPGVPPRPAPKAAPQPALAPPPEYEACGKIAGPASAQALAVSSDGSLLAVSGSSQLGSADLFRLGDKNRLFSITGQYAANANESLVFAGDSIAFMERDELRRFRVADGADLGLLQMKPRQGAQHLTALAVSHDAKLLAAGSYGGHLTIYETENFRVLHDFRAHMAPIVALAFGADGTLLSAGGMRVKLWDTLRGKLIRQFEDHTSTVLCVGLTAQDGSLLSSGVDRALIVRDLARDRVLLAYDIPFAARDCALLSGGTVAVVMDQGALTLYNASSGGRRELSVGIRAVTATADGSTLAALGYGGEVALYCRKP